MTNNSQSRILLLGKDVLYERDLDQIVEISVHMVLGRCYAL